MKLFTWWFLTLYISMTRPGFGGKCCCAFAGEATNGSFTLRIFGEAIPLYEKWPLDCGVFVQTVDHQITCWAEENTVLEGVKTLRLSV